VPPQFVSNVIVTNPSPMTNAVYTNEIAFQSSGMLNNLVVSGQGTFSGKLLLAGGAYGLSGTFNAFGQATNSVARPADLGGPLILDLNADTNGAGIITGTVSNAAWPSNADLWASLAAVTPGISNYTVLMASPTNAPTNGSIPPGEGYALIADHGGPVILSGGLADGTAFTQTVPLSPSNAAPVYISLYEKTGFLFGWLSLTNLNNTNPPGTLMWIKGIPPHPSSLFPDGFTNLLLTAGSSWTNPGVITLPSSNTLAISNASLDLNYTVAVKNNNELYNPSGTPTNSLIGTINLKTGFLQILFGNGDRRATTRGYGAMLQNTNYAGGYFVTKTNAGSIIFDDANGTNVSARPFSFAPASDGMIIEMFIFSEPSGPPLPPPVAVSTNGLDGSTSVPPPLPP
jgi:hypothetical protein